MKERIPYRWWNEFIGIVFLALAILIIISLVSFNHGDTSFLHHTEGREYTENFVGQFGANIAVLLISLFGLTAYVIPIILCFIGWNKFWNRPTEYHYTKAIGLGVMLLCLATLINLTVDKLEIGGHLMENRSGGELGRLISEGLIGVTKKPGALIITITALFLAVVITTHFSFSEMVYKLSRYFKKGLFNLQNTLARKRELRRKEKMRRKVIEKHTSQVQKITSPGRKIKIKKKKKAPPPGETAVDPPVTKPREKEEPPAERKVIRSIQAGEKGETYESPPLSLLIPPDEDRKINEKELVAEARLITEKYKEFSIEGKVVQIHPGPVVTTFEFKPSAGIKYSRITNLSDDLCLALKAESIRIDRLPGKSTVGLEVPNHLRDTIRLKELFASPVYAESKSKLTLALGKLIYGEPYVTDLSRMPHLLIAGSTGSGKSVCINSFICSIIYKSTPKEVRFIMIDPKRLELGLYDGIPFLLTPVVTEPKLASNALRWAVDEMDARYKKLAEYKVRNIRQFNGYIKKAKKAGELKDPDIEPLPFIVVIIDELADLMMFSSAAVEESITRLAQMARAVGIHLLVATQRPSVDVLTGVIKANFPSRISFRVASKVDSRTILDANGAEKLLGKGDMLFLPPGTSRLIRIHGTFISQEEVIRLCTYLTSQGKPVFNEAVLAGGESGGEDIKKEDHGDEMYDAAVRLVVSTGIASISNLQRKFRLGYTRAARLIDMMEDDGIVGPPQGSKPRQILVSKDYFEEIDSRANLG